MTDHSRDSRSAVTAEHHQHHGESGLHAPHAAHTGTAMAHKEHRGQNGHSGHTGHSEAMFERPFWIALVLTIPVLLYTDRIQALLHYHSPAFPGSAWLIPVLSSIIYWYCGWVFLSGAVS